MPAVIIDVSHVPLGNFSTTNTKFANDTAYLHTTCLLTTRLLAGHSVGLEHLPPASVSLAGCAVLFYTGRSKYASDPVISVAGFCIVWNSHRVVVVGHICNIYTHAANTRRISVEVCRGCDCVCEASWRVVRDVDLSFLRLLSVCSYARRRSTYVSRLQPVAIRNAHFSPIAAG